MADEQERFFQDLVDVHRLEERLGRAGETQELIHQRIDPVDFVPDQVREGLAEIGVLVTLRQSCAKVLIETSGFLISCAMPAESVPEAGEPVAAPNLEFQALQRGDVGQHHERAEHLACLAVEDGAAGAHHGAVGRRVAGRARDSPGGSPVRKRLAHDFAQTGRQADRAVDRVISRGFSPVICPASLLKTVIRSSAPAAITPVVRFCRSVSL